MRGTIAACAAALLVVTSATASAQGDADEAAARAHFESGRLHFDNGNYEMALREFQASYELSHRAELLYNLYVTSERLGDLPAAVEYLERFLADGNPEADRRAQLERRLRNLRERRDRTPSTTAPRRGDVVPAAIAFGVAGAGLLSFAITGGLALAEDGSIAAGCGATVSCTDAQLSTLGTLTVIADVSWVTAAVASAAGVVLLLTLGLDSGEAESARVVPLVSPTLAGVAVEGRF